MSESIFNRMGRVVSASVDSAVSTLERANRTGLMREALRDADRAIDRLVAEQRAAEARAGNAGRWAAAVRQELATLAEQAQFAVLKARDDLAEVAVARQLELEQLLVELGATQTQAGADAARLDQLIADLRERRQQMKDELVAVRNAESAAAALDMVAAPIDVRMETRVRRAEEAFDRAIEQAGGVSGRGSVRSEPTIAEIAALEKADRVAERMAALRSGTGPKPGGRRSAR